MKLIDSHCHLNYEGLAERQDEVLENARKRGVHGFLNISTRKREWEEVVGLAEREPDVWASIGVHPHEADAHPDLGAAALVEGADHPRVIAIGECGLDYYYDKSDRAAQRERFEAHIDAARQTGLPQDQASARVEQVLKSVDDAKAKAADAAETARKAAVLAAFLAAASLLVSAVGAYWAAMKGGKHRDEGTEFTGMFGRY